MQRVTEATTWSPADHQRDRLKAAPSRGSWLSPDRQARGVVVVDHPTTSDLSVASRSTGVVDRYRVLIVDDAVSTRRFLRTVLDQSPKFDVVGDAGDGNAAVQKALILQPDLVLLDISMPAVDGASVVIGVLEVASRAKVIVVSGMNPVAGAPFLAAGATGFIGKGVTPFELLERLEAILVSAPPEPVRHDSADEPTLDPAVVDELRLLGAAAEEDFLADLVTQFIHDTESLLVQLGVAFEVADARAVGRIAHGIKGCGSQLGGRRLASSCRRLEERATSDSLSDGHEDLHDIEVDFKELCRALRHHLSPRTVETPVWPADVHSSASIDVKC